MKKIVYSVVAMLIASNAIASTSNNSQQIRLLEQRVRLLESEFEPADADLLVKMFAVAVQERNGAAQYALFCNNLRSKYFSTFQEMNWVSGTSSPSVESFKINKLSDNQYTIDYSMGLQSKVVGTVVDTLEIKEELINDRIRYCVSAYSTK